MHSWDNNAERYRLGRIPLAVAIGNRQLEIHHQVVAVLHEHMTVAPRGSLSKSVAQLSWMGIGFPGEQSLGIGAGAVGLVAELDTVEDPFCPLLSFLGCTESLART